MTGNPNSSVPIPPRLQTAIQRVIRETRGFNERKQEAWCQVCRYKDPLSEKLHDPECPIYELHGAWEEALAQQWPEEHDRQLLLLALAICALDAPGFDEALRRIAAQLRGGPGEQDGVPFYEISKRFNRDRWQASPPRPK